MTIVNKRPPRMSSCIMELDMFVLSWITSADKNDCQHLSHSSHIHKFFICVLNAFWLDILEKEYHLFIFCFDFIDICCREISLESV